MTEKKSRFVSHQLIIDLFASLIFAFSVLTVVRMSVLYEKIADVSTLHLFSVILLTELFVFIRRIRIRLLPMFLLHVLPVAGYLFIMSAILTQGGRKNITESLIYLGVMAVANLGYSMLWRFRIASISDITYDIFIASIALHLILFVITVGTLRQVVILHALLIVCVFLAARQIYTFDTKYSHNAQSGARSVRQAKRQNYMTIVFISGGIILALLILNTIPISTILSALRSFIVMIGRFFRRLLPAEGDSDPNEKLIAPKDDGGNGEEPFFVQILFVVFAVVIACVFLATVFKAFCLFLKKFHMEGPMERIKASDDAVVDIIEEIYEEEEPRSFMKDFGDGYEREIRKKYYKTVQKAIRSGTRIDPSYTPEQIKSALKEKGDPSISELTSLYESVRYSMKSTDG
ncbi:MAG: hypothetical protein J5379_09385 [Clostridiales bacterium]|nr:hypothetical protein [Clostridiales bacterium]